MKHRSVQSNCKNIGCPDGLSYTALLQRILLLVAEKYMYHKNRENKIYSDFFSSEKPCFNIHVNPL